MKDSRGRVKRERSVRLNFGCSPTSLRVPWDRQHCFAREVYQYRVDAHRQIRAQHTVISESSSENELIARKLLLRVLGHFDLESGGLSHFGEPDQYLIPTNEP